MLVSRSDLVNKVEAGRREKNTLLKENARLVLRIVELESALKKAKKPTPKKAT